MGGARILKPDYREITIRIPAGEEDMYYPLLDAEATKAQVSVEALCTSKVMELATKLWHIQRCKPKPPVEARPIGRPRISPEQRRGMEAWEILEGIFDKLAKFKGEAFERLHGEQKRRAVEMCRVGDWQGLEKFLAERGWEKN